MAIQDEEQQSVRKSISGELNKLSQMNGSQKADYIFTYYKIHILLILGLILAVAWTIHHALTYVDYKFFGLVINSAEVNELREADIREYLGMDGHAAANLEAGLFTDEQSSGGYGSRLSVLLMAGQCDFVFTDEAGVEYLEDFFDDYDINITDISDSPIHEYFGLDDNTKYLIKAGLSGNEQYMADFDRMLADIENGSIN